MNKAFIFDMDGVLIDSESVWRPFEQRMLPEIFGEKIATELGSSMGLSLHDFYDTAIHLGATISRETFMEAYEKKAQEVYASAAITDGVEELGAYLLSRGFKIGLVSMSSQNWIDYTLAKISFRSEFGAVISLNRNPLLRPKPAPDGYKKAMEMLQARTESSIVLEDSNTGIRAGKDAGAYVIGFREHVPAGYHQVGADIQANDMTDVMNIVKDFEVRLATPQ